MAHHMSHFWARRQEWRKEHCASLGYGASTNSMGLLVGFYVFHQCEMLLPDGVPVKPLPDDSITLNRGSAPASP
jgi:hypothetical protein